MTNLEASRSITIVQLHKDELHFHRFPMNGSAVLYEITKVAYTTKLARKSKLERSWLAQSGQESTIALLATIDINWANSPKSRYKAV